VSREKAVLELRDAPRKVPRPPRDGGRTYDSSKKRSQESESLNTARGVQAREKRSISEEEEPATLGKIKKKTVQLSEKKKRVEVKPEPKTT